jgi:hypothetical protein
VRHPHWTSDHRDALLTRVTALTAGTAVVGAVGAVALGAGLQAGTHYKNAASTTPARTTPAPAAATPDPAASAAAPGTSTAGSGSSSGTGSTDPVSADQVHVAVYNATGVNGVGHAAAAVLAAKGFQIDTIATNPGGRTSTSGIVYSPDQVGAVKTLSRVTGIRNGSPTGNGATLVLVLGQDWLNAVAGSSWLPVQAAPQAPQQNNGGASNGGGTGNGGGPVTTTGGS